MSEENIWVSVVMMRSSLTRGFIGDIRLTELEKATNTAKRNSAGEALSADCFPKEIYYMYSDRLETKLPDICMAAGWVVSEAVADVLRQFDMGKGALYPVKVFQHDRKRLVEGTYFHLNYGNTKEAVLLEKTIGARKSPYPSGDQRRSFIGLINDGDIAIRAAALDGPDIWLDPQIQKTFFLSDRLVQALKKAKLARCFKLSRCKIVRDN